MIHLFNYKNIRYFFRRSQKTEIIVDKKVKAYFVFEFVSKIKKAS